MGRYKRSSKLPQRGPWRQRFRLKNIEHELVVELARRTSHLGGCLSDRLGLLGFDEAQIAIGDGRLVGPLPEWVVQLEGMYV